MKRIFFSGFFCFLGPLLMAQDLPKPELPKDSFYTLSPVEVRAVRAGEHAPFTKTNISQKTISQSNLGQDLPFMLNQTPAVVVNADAGNGIGYTGIRIRGTDATRINVTLNGIPYNDAESQGTFFVDLPDILSSAGSIQVIRGAGTSSNGAGAFGASINLSTNETNRDAYAELNNSAGSFNTWKNTVRLGTGVHKGFSAEGRFSRISSDGYIDRASSRLSSVYGTMAYTKDRSSFRLNVFSGKEKTYQAWYGVSEPDLRAGNRTINYAGTEKPGAPYDNETDNYTQTHYQLFFTQGLGKKYMFNTAFFYTKGKGYYEQYKADREYADYNLPYQVIGTDTFYRSDLVRQLWLDNDFYGGIFSLQYKSDKREATLGGSFTKYDGLHYGKVIWAARGIPGVRRYYDLDAAKTDLTLYAKEQTKIATWWHLYYDLQLRLVDYRINGFRDNPSLLTDRNFSFFNPKAGISFSRNSWKSYLSFAIANKEPNRDDFEAGASQQPRPEKLYDLEFGIERSKNNSNWAATLYYMDYKDQLVLTGKVNDVGAYSRTNIPRSFRRGIELNGGIRFNKWINGMANLALSENRVKDFTEFIDDYDNGGQKTNHFESPAIAFSPSVVGGATIQILPVKNLELSLISKYVSRQYLDNTENPGRSLAAFFTEDFRIIKKVTIKKIREFNITAQVYNLFDEKYEPNGYTFSYITGGSTVTENYYFPMAGRNFMVSVNIRL